MANMQITKTPCRELDPKYRASCFEEVSLGYTAEEAINEAKRCLNCKNKPCVSACPVGVKIPEFIAKMAEGDFEEAYSIIASTNSLPAVCGRVCPQESQCEGKCIRGIKGEAVAIGRLERFAADHHNKNSNTGEACENTGEAVAVVGSGPASLTCAGELAKKGYRVTVFEAFHTPGGVLVYGIPEFRLPKAVVRKETDALKALGVKFEMNSVIGKIKTVDELFEDGFKAVFIGTGAGLPAFLNIPGENACGVYSANEFLTRINLMKAYLPEYDTPIKKSRRVAVVGGGNVAMDAARCALRLGAEEVNIVYRRSEAEMPARLEEVHHAKEEGVIFRFLNNPTKINEDASGRVASVTCVRMELGEPDASGRRRPVPIAGSEYDIPVDTVIIAVGTTPNPLIRMTTPGLETDRRGCIIAPDGVTTSRKGVFAGGDAVTGAATVILAMGAGRDAAAKIDEYIRSL